MASLPRLLPRSRRLARELAPVAVLALVILVARSSLADHYWVPSGSMEPTLQPGDYVLVDKTAYGLRVPFTGWRLTGGESPAPGEIVIFDAPRDGTRLIKRVIAVGGNRVAVRDGNVYLDGDPTWLPGRRELEQLGERRVPLDLRYGGGPDLGPLRIPRGFVLVMGDARGNSRDGRSFGLIPEDSIYARAEAVYLRRGAGLVWRRL